MTVGMRPGFSIDIGNLKPDGIPWNLEDDIDFRLLRLWREEEKPFLLCGSPPCNAFFSKMMEWYRSRMDPKKHKEIMRAGRLHLQRSCDLYRDQIKDGLFFLHEFPNGLSSIYEPCLDSLIKEPGVYLVKSPMCA